MLAGVLRPGNAGANNAADHLRVLELALEQLPQPALDGEILAGLGFGRGEPRIRVRVPGGRYRFSLGYAINTRARAILALPESAWQPALNADGEPREGAWVAELTGRVNLDLGRRAPG